MRKWLLSLTASLALFAPPAAAQLEVVIHGRIEDAVSREALSGVRVTAANDPMRAVISDANGSFAIQVPQAAVYSVRTERVGYLAQHFELEGDPLSRTWTLLVEPVAVEVESLEVVAETAVEKVLRDLYRRRNSYPGSVRSFDRAQLERFYSSGTVWDLVRSRVPQIFECGSSSGLCVRGRARTPGNPFPEDPVSVCVDAWQSWGAATELSSLDIRSVALVEIYGNGRGGIRVYTPAYLLTTARHERNIINPFGC